jgi:hypothetical protein
MATRSARAIALAGVLVTAALTTLLLMPAIREVGGPGFGWLAAAIMIVPTATVLTASGWPYYGPLRSPAVGVGVMALTSLITWVVAVFTFAAALSGSTAGVILGIVLYLTPALCVLVFGLLAMRIVATADETGQHRVETTHS